MSGGAIEWKTICRKLARKPTHRGFTQWNKSTPQKTKQLGNFLTLATDDGIGKAKVELGLSRWMGERNVKGLRFFTQRGNGQANGTVVVQRCMSESMGYDQKEMGNIQENDPKNVTKIPPIWGKPALNFSTATR